MLVLSANFLGQLGKEEIMFFADTINNGLDRLKKLSKVLPTFS